MKRNIITSSLILLMALAANAQDKPGVLTRVLETYGGKWPRTLSFTQATTLFTPTGQTRQTCLD